MKQKMADWLLDIAKYIITGVVLTSIFGSLEKKWQIVLYGILGGTICIGIGLSFMLSRNDIKKIKKIIKLKVRRLL